MVKKVIERTERIVEANSGKPSFWTDLSFVGGIDLSRVKGRLRDSEHIRLMIEGRENTLTIGTSPQYVEGEYPTKYIYSQSLIASRKSGRRNDLGFLELETDEEGVAFRRHLDAINALKSAYLRS